MKLIIPHKIVSRKVKRYRDIKDDAHELATLVNRDNFDGKYKRAFAISHCQVSAEPYAFFCVHKDLMREFGTDTVVNATIISQSDPMAFREACMSFGFRPEITTRRYAKVTVQYQYPTIIGTLRTTTRDFEGLPAFIVQHEIDHAKAINIYDRFKR